MRVKLIIDKSVGLSEDFSRVWFELDTFLHSTIHHCELEIQRFFQLGDGPFALDLDGFRLLGHLSTSVMLQDGATLQLYRVPNPAPPSPAANNSKKRERPFSPVSSTVTPNKLPKTTSPYEHPEEVTISPFIISGKPKPKSTKLKTKKTIPITSSPSSTSSSSTTTSSSSSTSSSSDTSSSTSTSSSSDWDDSSSSEEVAVPEPQAATPTPASASFTQYDFDTKPKLNARRRKSNKAAESKASNDYVQSVSRVYVNLIEDVQPVQVHQYHALPKIALADVIVGQIVAWRMFCLSPSKTPGYAPWQERQLVESSSEGLTFRSHNLNAYLASWWLDDDGERMCTVRDWLKENPEENPLDVTLPLDSSDIGDLRLLHSADSN